MEPTPNSVSVIVPAFNAARYLPDALASALAQDHPPHEVIVVDDGSTDGTSDLLRDYGPPVRWVSQPNQGESAARNTGLGLATGAFVALLDADDVCRPDRLRAQVEALAAAPDAVGCFTGYWRFDETGTIEHREAESPVSHRDPLFYLSRCPFHVPTVMFRRCPAADVRFPVGVKSGPDIIFSALLATVGRFVSCPAPLYGYRTHPAQISHQFKATGDSNKFFEGRYGWAREHWAEHWPDRGWPEVERHLWDGLAAQTEAAYWARHRQFFLNDRDYIRRAWPAHLPPPAVRNWRWYPDWLWNMKNAVDRWRGQ